VAFLLATDETNIMNLLGSPIWTGIAALIALVSLFLTIFLERERLKLRPLGQRLPFAIVNLLIGILIMSLGFILQPTISNVLQSGIRGGEHYLNWLLTQSPFSILVFGLFPGSLTVAAISTGKTRLKRLRVGVIAAVVTLSVQDLIVTVIDQSPLSAFLFDILSNIVGGILAGIIIGYFMDILSNWFDETVS
jgi:hypothetical protein